MSELTSEAETILGEERGKHRKLRATLHHLNVSFQSEQSFVFIKYLIRQFETLKSLLIILTFQTELENKSKESEELSELTSIYSRKVTKLENSLKSEKNKEDESYIEITFPLAAL